MGHFRSSRHDGRQVSVLVAALLFTTLLLALAPGARGETPERPNSDADPEGTTYVAGELLVVYEPGTSEDTRQSVVRESGGQTVKDLPGEVRLISFPSVMSEQSGETREQELQSEARGPSGRSPRRGRRLQLHPRGYVPTRTTVSSATLASGVLRKAGFPNAWNDARGTGAKIAIIDSGINQDHSDIGKISAQKDFVNGRAVANDGYGHGTHVAGIAGALTDNGRGVAGGCPACKLLVAKVMNSRGEATDFRT